MGDSKREEQEVQVRWPLVQQGTSLLLTSLGKSRQTEHWKRDRSRGGGRVMVVRTGSGRAANTRLRNQKKMKKA